MIEYMHNFITLSPAYYLLHYDLLSISDKNQWRRELSFNKNSILFRHFHSSRL